MNPPEHDACLDCGRPLRTAISRSRGRGPLCHARHVAAHPWLAWHRSPPRMGHVPSGPVEGQAALFEAQPMLPTLAREDETTITNGNEE